MNFSENLKVLRKECGLSAKELSKKLSCSVNIIYDWEHSRCEPSFSTLVLLSKIFNVSVGYLLGIEDDFGNVVISAGTPAELSEQEKELLTNFNMLNIFERDSILIQVKALAEKQMIKK